MFLQKENARSSNPQPIDNANRQFVCNMTNINKTTSNIATNTERPQVVAISTSGRTLYFSMRKQYVR